MVRWAAGCEPVARGWGRACAIHAASSGGSICTASAREHCAYLACACLAQRPACGGACARARACCTSHPAHSEAQYQFTPPAAPSATPNTPLDSPLTRPPYLRLPQPRNTLPALPPPCRGALQIQATPACHCITSDGLYQVKPPAPAALAMGASRVALDDFAPPACEAYRPSKQMGAGEARRDHIDGIVKMCAGRAGWGRYVLSMDGGCYTCFERGGAQQGQMRP